MSVQQYITDYKAHIKKPVQQQIKEIAHAYCEFHDIEYSKINRNTQSIPMRIKLLHRLLRDASVLYSCDAQAQAFKLSEYLILRRINDTH